MQPTAGSMPSIMSLGGTSACVKVGPPLSCNTPSSSKEPSGEESPGPTWVDVQLISDRGVPYVSIRYTERLAEAGIEPSVGDVGDSYDNVAAETITVCQSRGDPPTLVEKRGGGRAGHARLGGRV
jgi:hypothetical protein